MFFVLCISLNFFMMWWCKNKTFNLHRRGPSLSPSKGLYTIKFLCQMEDLKVEVWYKYVFSQSVGERMYFWDGALEE